MKQKKKNKFYTFLLSFMPGAAEMYMGFMKKGISLMAVFIASIMVCVYLEAEILAFTSVLIWFYSFFHARNLTACEESVFENLQDDYVWAEFVNERNITVSNPVLRKWAAGILIVFGAVLLWQNMSRMIYNLIPDRWWNVLSPIVSSVPEVVVAILIIYIGLRMIQGKKEELESHDE